MASDNISRERPRLVFNLKYIKWGGYYSRSKMCVANSSLVTLPLHHAGSELHNKSSIILVLCSRRQRQSPTSNEIYDSVFNTKTQFDLSTFAKSLHGRTGNLRFDILPFCEQRNGQGHSSQCNGQRERQFESVHVSEHDSGKLFS